MTKTDVYLIDGLRTPIASPHRSLKTFTAAQLAGHVIREIVRRNKINKEKIDEVILGNVVAAGTGQNVSRQAAVLAGLPYGVDAYTVNNVCGAGLQAVVSGLNAIWAGTAQLVVAGGTESATHNPYLVKKSDEHALSKDVLKDSLHHDGLFCQMTKKSMGQLVEGLVRKHRISREDQDAYALESHRRACWAKENKKFADEIVPLRTSRFKKIDSDDRPRKSISLESLAHLSAAFAPKGSITSGNASSPADGAAVVVLASGNAVKTYHLRPKARILGYRSVMVKPEETFEAAVLAIRECLEKYQLALEGVNLFEVAESFAAHALFTQRKLKIPKEKLNIYGGDLAFGHPLGAAGARILVTLLHALEKEKRQTGMACIAYGGGGAQAMMIERVY